MKGRFSTLTPWLSRIGVNRVIFAAVAILCSVVTLRVSGVKLDSLFARDDAHRLQTAALLDGHFWLSESIYDVRFDNAFVHGKVQQIWGLGAPLYAIPLELIGRAVGRWPVPDRLTLGVLIAWFIYYCLTGIATLKVAGLSAIQRVGVIIIVLFSPPLYNLIVICPQSVYDDASIFALLTSLGLLMALLRVLAANHSSDFLICCFLAGMTGLVRPTHLVYGLLGAALAGISIWATCRPKRVRLLAIGGTIYIGCVCFLLVSNAIRFDGVLEFGHTETLTANDCILTTRFINPIRTASVFAASKELLGAMFFAPLDIREMGNAFAQDLFPGQVNCFRWRDFYVTTYDASIAAIVGVGIAYGAYAVARRLLAVARRKSRPTSSAERDGRGLVSAAGPPVDEKATRKIGQSLIFRCMYLWGVTSFALIFVFMMYYPGLCARYLYDFWPGIAALTVVVWLLGSTLYPRESMVVLIGWLVFELGRCDCRLDKNELPLNSQISRAHFHDIPRHLKSAGLYDATHLPPKPLAQSVDFENHVAEYVATIPVDSPKFVEFVVGRRTRERSDVYRARIGVDELRLLSVTPEAEPGWKRVRFEVPQRIVERCEDELLVLCFVERGNEDDFLSERQIRSVRWR